MMVAQLNLQKKKSPNCTLESGIAQCVKQASIKLCVLKEAKGLIMQAFFVLFKREL
jgi:hypothetical protein